MVFPRLVTKVCIFSSYDLFELIFSRHANWFWICETPFHLDTTNTHMTRFSIKKCFILSLYIPNTLWRNWTLKYHHKITLCFLYNRYSHYIIESFNFKFFFGITCIQVLYSVTSLKSINFAPLCIIILDPISRHISKTPHVLESLISPSHLPRILWKCTFAGISEIDNRYPRRNRVAAARGVDRTDCGISS